MESKALQRRDTDESKAGDLCFLEACKEKKKGNITFEKYIKHMLAHCTGVEHGDQDDANTFLYDTELSRADPFGFSMRNWTLQWKNQVKDTRPFEAVFAAYRTGSLEDIKSGLAALQQKHVGCIRKSLTMLSVIDRRADVLQLCFDQGGFRYDTFLNKEANKVRESEDPETFRVLENSQFRKEWPRRRERDPDYGPWDDPNPDYDPAAEFDEGGSCPIDW